MSPRIPENQIVTKQCKHSVYCKVSLKCTPPNILQFDFLLFVFVKLGCHTDVAKPDNAPCSQRKQCSLVSPDSLFWDATLCLVTTRHHLVLGRDTTVANPLSFASLLHRPILGCDQCPRSPPIHLIGGSSAWEDAHACTLCSRVSPRPGMRYDVAIPLRLVLGD